MLLVAVRDMRERQSDHADFAVRPSRCLQEMLRQDDPDGRLPKTTSAPLCHLQGQDPPPQGQWTDGVLGLALFGT